MSGEMALPGYLGMDNWVPRVPGFPVPAGPGNASLGLRRGIPIPETQILRLRLVTLAVAAQAPTR
eukprot:3103343-Rhodomonas_salina.1